MKTLDTLREQINELDERLLMLLSARATLALEVGAAKKASDDPVTFRPEREQAVLKSVVSKNKGPLDQAALLAIYKKIISACRSLQSPLNIAFLGPLGSFSHEASSVFFGAGVKEHPCTTIEKVFERLERGEVNYSLVPIENSTEGIVNKTLDRLAKTDLNICGEVVLPVHHYVLSRCDDLSQISQIYSHPQALAQCADWLAKSLPNAAVMPVRSTSRACVLASKEATTAAIASKIALDYHDLNILEKNIEDDPNNATRFYILGRQIPEPTRQDKTTMLVWIPHKPGALARLLGYFSENKINLTMIESRPYAHQMWEYIFFLEMDGHQEEPKIKRTIAQLLNDKITVNVLGSYPKAM
jgi:chorismate mutase / prephenate dehydratase